MPHLFEEARICAQERVNVGCENVGCENVKEKKW